MSKYQIMPDLSADEFAELKADIAERGVQVPIECDEQGNVLDGHHRIKACKELGITTWPKIIRQDFTDEEKRTHAQKLNLARRHLNQAQRRELIKAQLKETPEKSDRQIAHELGVSNPTVSSVRKALEAKGDVLNFNTSIDRLERRQPRRRKHQYVDDSPEGRQAILGGARKIKTQKRRERDAAREAQLSVLNAQAHALEEERYKLVVSDISDLHTPPVDAIITDPPYGKEYLDLYTKLGLYASRSLKEGGVCAVMCGQAYLPEKLSRLNEHLTYLWACAYLTPGATLYAWSHHARCNWKPVAIFIKGENKLEYFSDVFKSEGSDKQHHVWGQSVDGMRQIIEAFTVPGMLVCDPFCGASTTGVATLLAKRLYIGADIDNACIQRSAIRLNELEADAA